MGRSHTLVQWKMTVTCTELWPPFPVPLVLVLIVPQLEHVRLNREHLVAQPHLV